MPRKLKVFRTPTGFHDAYVTVPSRKAALEAWGADADLFARGTAEEVTDARLTAEPLRHPGEVIRVSRGDLAAQLKALGPRKKPAAKKKAEAKPERRPPKPKPPPRRDKVDKAEAALDRARHQQASERAALQKQRDAIERKLDALEARHDKEIARLEERFEKARATYRAALEKWSG
jgi:chromosome segregation ATPase